MTKDLLLPKSKSAEEKTYGSVPISSRASSSRESFDNSDRLSTTSHWSKASDRVLRPSFTSSNNSKVYNGDAPRMSSEEIQEEQSKVLNNENIRTWPPKVRKVLWLVNSETKKEKSVPTIIGDPSSTENRRNKQTKKLNKM